MRTYLKQMYPTLYVVFFQNVRPEKSKCVKVHWELLCCSVEYGSIDYCTLIYWNRRWYSKKIIYIYNRKRCSVLNRFILANITELPSVFIICGYRGQRWKHSLSFLQNNLSWGVAGLASTGACAICFCETASLALPRIITLQWAALVLPEEKSTSFPDR